MKQIRILPCAFAALAALALQDVANAQTVITTTEPGATVATRSTTTRVGRVSTVSPDLLMMEHSTGTEPITYSRTTRTVYVDETGATIPAETIRVGTPVTVHYSGGPDRLVADRVVVQRRAVVEPAVTERRTVVESPAVVERPVKVEKKTTTTTTTEPTKKVIVDDDDDD